MKLNRSTSISTPAKINLFINIQKRRNDGYHQLILDLIPVSLYDRITFSPPSHQSTELISNLNLGSAEENLIIKAIRQLESYTGKNLHLNVKLEKYIPVGAGLGGGSGNAAGTLVVLNQLFGLNLEIDELMKVAALIGADVPFFIQPKPAHAKGIGDDLSFLPRLEPLKLLVIFPGFSISTSEAYKDCTISGRRATITDYSIPELAVHTPEMNDFWMSLSKKFPVLNECRNRLIGEGAMMAGLSGSGSGVFGIFQDRKSRDNAYKGLAAKKEWQVFPCETLNRHSYL